MKSAFFGLGWVVLCGACSGEIFTRVGISSSTPGNATTPGGSTSPAAVPTCTGGCVDLSPIAAITRLEYTNAVQDVFGITGVDVGGLPDDGSFDGFAGNAASERSNADATSYETIAVEVAEGARTQLLQQCANATCISDFIRSHGALLLRRPLSDDDANDYETLYQTTSTATGASHADGLVAVVSALLQDPSFLYKVEGTASDVRGSVRALAPHELAGRLASYLWRSVPDATLLDAATTGALATPDGARAQIERMMADPRLDRALQVFHEDWFGASAVPAGSTLDPLLAADMQEEQARFVTGVVRSGTPTLEQLFTSTQAPLTSRLATFYGVAAPATDWSPVAMPDRAGVLGRAFPLVTNSGTGSATRAIYRGLLVYTKLLCQTVGAPPPDAASTTQSFVRQPGWSDRDYLTHLTMTAGTKCVGCHGIFNPLGFAFDAYDLNGQKTDPTADSTGTFDGVAFDGPNALQQRLLGTELEGCATKKWLAFALSREPQADDVNSVVAGTQNLLTGVGKLDLHALIAQLPSVDAFRSRRFAP